MRAGTVVLVAVLVLLSGCSTILSGGTPTPDGTNASDGAGQEAERPAQTADAYPKGYAVSGVTNASAAVQAHQTSVLDAPGFTITYDAVVETANGTTTVTYVQRVEVSSREVLSTTNITGGGTTVTLTQYYANDTLYQRTESATGNGVRYSNRSKRYELRSFTGVRLVRPLVSNVSYESSEVITLEGSRAVRYTNGTLADRTELLGGDIARTNVTAFDATLVVDADGVVRRIEYAATVETDGERTVTVTLAIEPGAVTVNRPSWVTKA